MFWTIHSEGRKDTKKNGRGHDPPMGLRAQHTHTVVADASFNTAILARQNILGTTIKMI